MDLPNLKLAKNENKIAKMHIISKSGIALNVKEYLKENNFIRYIFISFVLSNLKITNPIITIKNVINVAGILPILLRIFSKKIDQGLRTFRDRFQK